MDFTREQFDQLREKLESCREEGDRMFVEQVRKGAEKHLGDYVKPPAATTLKTELFTWRKRLYSVSLGSNGWAIISRVKSSPRGLLYKGCGGFRLDGTSEPFGTVVINNPGLVLLAEEALA